MKNTLPAEEYRLQNENLQDLLWRAVEELSRQFDWENGGFGTAPKFPAAQELNFLLEYARRTGDGDALGMAERTLTRMAQGGIFDRTGGFFRYSDSEDWQEPYPEKALCDNALLSCAYLEAYVQTGRPLYREMARQTLEFGLKKLGLPGGGFASTRKDGSLWRDGEVLAAWNAMMIAALTKADRVLGDERYLKVAQDARLFLETRLTQPGDGAFYCWALLELYETDFSTACLREAAEIAERMDPLDLDEAAGGAAALALGRLARLTGRERFRVLAERQLARLAEVAEDSPAAHCASLLALLEEAYPNRELVCVSGDVLPQWLSGARETYRLTVLAKAPENCRELEELSPRAAEYPLPEAGKRFYLCRDGVCEPAADSLEELRALMRSPERELVLL